MCKREVRSSVMDSSDLFGGLTTNMSCNFPVDLVIDILIRLPIKSLIRFRCVCKPFCALIKNPNFAIKHLNSSTHKRSLFLINRWHRLLSRVEKSIDLVDYITLQLHTDVYRPPSAIDSDCFRVVGSANGLLCVRLSRLGLDIGLWNPAIQESRRVPRSSIDLGSIISSSRSAFHVYLGFGFCGNINDYKLVRIVYFQLSNLHSPTCQVEVYTLSTDSWREISNVRKSVIDDTMCASPVVVDGVFYWTANAGVVSFNVASDEFGKIALPILPKYEDYYHGRDDEKLAELKGSLALIFSPFSETCKAFDIWVLNDDGVVKSWTKHLTIKVNSRDYYFFGFWENGDVVVEDAYHTLLLYEFSIQKTHPIKHGISSEAITYVESLVSLE